MVAERKRQRRGEYERVTVQLPPAMVARLDAVAEKMRGGASRAAVSREAIERFLQSVDKPQDE